MPRPRSVPPLIVSADDEVYLNRLARSRTDSVSTVTRARILAACAAGASGPAIARTSACPCRR